MFFTTTCTHCSKPLKVRNENVGKSARCPYCRATFVVAAPAEEPPLAVAATPAAPVSRAPSPGAQPAFQLQQPAREPAAQPPAARRPASSAGLSVTPDNDVRVLIHILVGIVGTALFYLALWPIAYNGPKQTYIGRLFIGTSTMAQGGWVPIAEVFLFFWAIGMLVEKWLKIRRQQRGLLYDVLPATIGDTISLANIDAFLDHIRTLPKDSVGSFLVTRCVRGLEHFRVRKSAPDTATMLSSQSDLDASSVDSSYTMFHVFIWAIPILGFLGTVIGVSTAVGSFTDTLEGSSDLNAMKTALKGITGGLATAFDTTLVALAMAMILTFPVSGLQKFEGDLVGQVDEYTNENLLRRLDDGLEGGAERGIGGSRAEMKKAFDEVMAPHLAQLENWGQALRQIGDSLVAELHKGWTEVDGRLVAEHARHAERIAQSERLLESWTQRVGGIGSEIAAQLKDGWRDVNSQLVAEHSRQTERLAQTERQLESWRQRMAGLADELAGQVKDGWREVNSQLVSEHGRQAERLGSIDALLARTGENLAGVATDTAAAREQAARLLADAAVNVERYTASLEKGLTALAETLTRLDGKQLVIEAQPVESRPWWGVFGGGRNGRR